MSNNIRIYNKSLCPLLWHNMKLDADARINLLKASKDFYEKTEFKAPIKDICLMGSSANFNWTPESDLDIHIIIDFNQLQMPEDTAKQMVKAVSAQWNNDHNIIIKGHKVELNFQDVRDTKPHVTGIYSLVKNSWARIPQKEKLKVDKNKIIKNFNRLKVYITNSIKTGDREYMKAVKEYMDAFRQYGLDSKGELSTENITFKVLRAKGIIKQLKDAITRTYDGKLSVKEKILPEVRQKDIKSNFPHTNNPVMDEGYGAGKPDGDRLNIPNHRWQIKSKDAPKTPKMEGFDPTSAGPRPEATTGQPPSDDFYRDEIHRMQQMEENDGASTSRTETSEFKSWFGNSKVIDKHGKPLQMFHGTGNKFSEFNKSRNWFTSDPSVAEEYANDAANHRYVTKGNASIIPVYISIKNPVVFHPHSDLQWHEAMSEWTRSSDHEYAKLGHDGVIFHYKNSTVAYPFDSNQIKSVFNQGTWNKSTNNISKEGMISELLMESPKLETLKKNKKPLNSAGPRPEATTGQSPSDDFYRDEINKMRQMEEKNINELNVDTTADIHFDEDDKSKKTITFFVDDRKYQIKFTRASYSEDLDDIYYHTDKNLEIEDFLNEYSTYVISFYHVKESDEHPNREPVKFHRKIYSLDKSAKHSAIKVYSHVLKSINLFLNTYSPNFVVFTPSENRQGKIYNKFIAKFIAKFNYTLLSHDPIFNTPVKNYQYIFVKNNMMGGFKAW